MNENDLERRVEELENHVYSNKKKYDPQKEKKISYLKKKLREAGDVIEEMQSKIDSLEARVEQKKKIEESVREIDRKADNIKNMADKREQQLDSKFDKELDKLEEYIEEMEQLSDSMDSNVNEMEKLATEIKDRADLFNTNIAKFGATSLRNTQMMMRFCLSDKFPDSYIVNDFLGDMFVDNWMLSQEDYERFNSLMNQLANIIEELEDQDRVLTEELLEASLLWNKMGELNAEDVDVLDPDEEYYQTLDKFMSCDVDADETLELLNDSSLVETLEFLIENWEEDGKDSVICDYIDSFEKKEDAFTDYMKTCVIEAEEEGYEH